MNPPLRGTNGTRDVIPFGGDTSGPPRLLGSSREDRRVAVFATSLTVGAVALALGLFVAGATIEASPWFVIALGLMGLVAERQVVQISANLQISVSFLPLLAATLFGPLEAMLVAVVTLAGDFGRPYARWMIWTSSRALGAGAALAAAAVATDDPSFGNVCAAVAAAAFAEVIIDAVLGATTGALRGIASFRATLQLVKPVLLGTVLYTPVVVLLIYACQEISEWSVIVFVAPAFAAHRFHSLYREERDARQSLMKSTRLQRANLSLRLRLWQRWMPEIVTPRATRQPLLYARDIAARMDLSEEDQRLAHLCGLVHDIGKIGLPPGLPRRSRGR